MDALRPKIPPVIIRIGHGLLPPGLVLPDQFIQGIVGVGGEGVALGEGGEISPGYKIII
jgi:hypothetical protein